MKRLMGWTVFLLVLLLALSSGSVLFAADDDITVEIDGQRVNFSDQQAVVVGGRTLVPVRGVFETLGYSVNWEQSTRTATLSNGVNTVLVTVDSPVAISNGKPLSLDVPAQVINGRTMLPFRAVLESVGCGVDWDGNNRTVKVSSGNRNRPSNNSSSIPTKWASIPNEHKTGSGDDLPDGSRKSSQSVIPEYNHLYDMNYLLESFVIDLLSEGYTLVGQFDVNSDSSTANFQVLEDGVYKSLKYYQKNEVLKVYQKGDAIIAIPIWDDEYVFYYYSYNDLWRKNYPPITQPTPTTPTPPPNSDFIGYFTWGEWDPPRIAFHIRADLTFAEYMFVNNALSSARFCQGSLK